MVMAQPHFLLFCDTHLNASSEVGARLPARSGRWHFVLEQLDGSRRLEAADSESAVNKERLALLSVVRGLEALEQPSRVTLVTTSRYVSRGLRYGLSTWQSADYKWERFGVQMPIRNADLWRRINGAMGFHGITCRLVQSEVDESKPVPAIADSSTVNEQAAVLNPPVESEVISARQIQLSVPRVALNRIRSSTTIFSHSGRELWWKLAATWIRWWRGRLRAKPALYGA